MRRSVTTAASVLFLLTIAPELIRHASYEPARRSRCKAALLTIGWFTITTALFEGLIWLSGTRPAHADLRENLAKPTLPETGTTDPLQTQA